MVSNIKSADVRFEVRTFIALSTNGVKTLSCHISDKELVGRPTMGEIGFYFFSFAKPRCIIPVFVFMNMKYLMIQFYIQLEFIFESTRTHHNQGPSGLVLVGINQDKKKCLKFEYFYLIFIYLILLFYAVRSTCLQD